jgi:hypothetical protein
MINLLEHGNDRYESVDHRRLHIAVAQQFLHSADVVAVGHAEPDGFGLWAA